MNPRVIKIATRASRLAMWQANQIKTKIEQHDYKCELVPVETSGDNQQNQPAYSFGITGIFTKQLDTSLLNQQTDIAVHSLKDVPTSLAENLILAATIERGAYEDIIIIKNNKILSDFTGQAKIATGSLRRKAQWLSKYPNHNIVPIRGNVETRLRKFQDDKTMDGIIFAKAGLERLGIIPEGAVTLSWMLPAAAQGIVGVVCRENDSEMISLCKKINNNKSYTEALTERDFLRTLMGGCSVPIGVHAQERNGKIYLQGGIYDYDGSQKFIIEHDFDVETKNAGNYAAAKLMKNKKAASLMEKIRNMDLKKQEYDNE